MKNAKHHRRSIRLKNYDYSSAGAYFITICAYNKECLFGNIVDGKMQLNDAGKIIRTVWDEIPKYYLGIETDTFQIMPNHMHGIIIINEVGAIHELPLQRRNMILPKIIGRLKMNTAKQINIIRKTPGSSVWQRNYYEHIIRSEESLNRMREYIQNNQLKWGLDEYNPDKIRTGGSSTAPTDGGVFYA